METFVFGSEGADASSLPAALSFATRARAEAEAYEQLLSYYRSFGLEDRRKLRALARRVLDRVVCPMEESEDGAALARAALAEAEREVAAWMAEVLGPTPWGRRDYALLGRAAFLSCEGGTRWAELFLAPAPWPEAFVAQMREAVLMPTPEPAPRPMEAAPFRFVAVEPRRLLAWLKRRSRAIGRREAAAGEAAWRPVVRRRRALLFGATLALTGAATAALLRMLEANGLDLVDALLALLFALNFGWIAFGFLTALAGFVVKCRGGLRPLVPEAAPERLAVLENWPRTAVVMPVYNEDVAAVFARLEATYLSLKATGKLAPFEFFVLSDSTDPDCWIAEQVAWSYLCRRVGGQGRIFYRRRRRNTAHKSGNIADFCRRWGGRYSYMVVLDADSVMTGETLVRLVERMEANPRAGIIQTVPVPVNRRTLYARIQQFSARLYGPLFAAGMSYWQGGDSNFWGHNAILRVEPFAQHAALPPLPGRGPLSGVILSHDFVEAAKLRSAGWEAWFAPDLPGSYEETPPTLTDHAKRDRRWCQGNLQHLRLLLARGFVPISRLHFAMGAMSYASSLFWLVFIAVGLLVGLRESELRGPFAFVSGHVLGGTNASVTTAALFGTTLALLFLPKLLALSFALWRRELAQGFGGPWSLLASAVLETLFATLLAPVFMLFHSSSVLTILAGRPSRWSGQRRGDKGIPWREALARHWSHTLAGAALALFAYFAAPSLLFWLAPVYGALLLSIPLSQFSSSRDFGRRARRLGLFLIPEEVALPPVLRHVARALGRETVTSASKVRRADFANAVSDRRINALHLALLDSEGGEGEAQPAGAPAVASASAPNDKMALLLDRERFLRAHLTALGPNDRHAA